MSNLNFDQVAANQNQKEVTINDAFDQVDGAITEHLAVDLSAADVSLTADQWTRNWFFEMGGHTVARTVTLPPTKRPGVVKNAGTGTVTLQVLGGGSAVVQPAQTVMVYNDGTNLAISGGGISDAPSDGKTYGRKDGAWSESNGDVLIADLSPSATGTVSVSGIPNAYKSLRIVGVARSTGTGTGSFVIGAQFNGDAGANYTVQRSFGNKSTAFTDQQLNATSARVAEAPAAGAYSSIPGTFEIIIPFYAETAFSKTFFSRWFNIAGSTADATFNINASGYWNSTASINRVDLILASGNFAAGTHILVYGVK